MLIIWRSWFFILLFLCIYHKFLLIILEVTIFSKMCYPKMQRHVLSSPCQHSEAREVMPGSGDPQKTPGVECIKYLPKLGMSIKFSGWYADAASLWLYIYLCIYGNSYKLPVELSIVAVWLFFFLIFFTSCVELDLKMFCNLFFQLA